MKSMKKTLTLIITLLVALAFAGNVMAQDALAPLPAQMPNDKASSAYDWTPAQIEKFAKQPWTDADKAKMGKDAYILNKDLLQPRATGKDLTPAQLYQNGKNVWLPVMWQYGVGMSMKDFHKIWVEEEKWKDPNHILLDLRMESEFHQGRPPGARRLDTGLDYWLLPSVAPKPDATYYLMCKSGTPMDGGIRGAYVKKHMIDMGYTGPIYNLTDGFRGWIELGYPMVNRHGHFNLIPGTFQAVDPYAAAQKEKGAVLYGSELY